MERSESNKYATKTSGKYQNWVNIRVVGEGPVCINWQCVKAVFLNIFK